MTHDYLPRRDAEALQWMKAFAGGIAAQPSAYMLSPSDGVALMRAVNEYEEALAAANPQSTSTRTAGTVVQKAVARRAAEQICRHYYALIKINGCVADTAKIDIGVRPINPARVRINCPTTSPFLSVIAATPGQHTLVYRDSMAPTSRAKPFGATALQLMMIVDDVPAGPGAAGDPKSGARLVGQFTTNPMSVMFTSADDRRKATYYGRWVSRRGEVGPWSLPVSMTIVA